MSVMKYCRCSVKATVIPTTWDDGRQVQLIIPHQRVDERHQVFACRITITPLELGNPNVSRQALVQSQPRVADRRPPSETHAHKRSMEKEVLIVGSSAGAGAAIGAVAGGGKVRASGRSRVALPDSFTTSRRGKNDFIGNSYSYYTAKGLTDHFPVARFITVTASNKPFVWVRFLFATLERFSRTSFSLLSLGACRQPCGCGPT